MKEVAVIPGIAILKTKVSLLFGFKFSTYVPNYKFKHLRLNSEKNKISIEYVVDDKITRIRNLPKTQFYNYYETDLGDIYYSHSLGWKLRANFMLRCEKYSDKCRIKMIVNTLYHKLIRTPIGNILPPGSHLNNVLCIALLENSLAPLHASAFSYKGEGTVIFAPSDTGKTSCVLHATINRGCKFLSEDIAVTNGDEIYSCPFTFSSNKYINNKNFFCILQKISDAIPIVRNYFNFWPIIRVTMPSIVGEKNIEPKAKIKRILVLKRGMKNKSRRLGEAEAIDCILNLNRSEFPYSDLLLHALHYFGKVNLFELMNREKNIIANMVSNAEEILLLEGNREFFITKINEIV